MEILKSRIIWDGKWRVRVNTVRMADGADYERAMVEHPGAVVLAPLVTTADGAPALLMLRQYRPTLGTLLFELPAGTREGDEPWLQCAQRELREETGYRAAEMISLGEVWAAPGMSDERMALFLATGLTADPLPMDIDEEITVETWPLEELVAMAIDGRLEDAKSVIAILRLAHRLSQQ